MSFNAYERFRGAIVNTLVDYPIISNKKITDKEDLRNVLEILSKTNIGFTLEYIEKHAPFGINNIDTKEIKFKNGLTYVESKISFYDDKLYTCNLNQIFVINNDNKNIIINLNIFENTPYSLFRNTLRKVVSLDIKNSYIISYTTYIDKNTNEIEVEEYIRNYHYEGTDIDDISLLDSLNANSKTLKFIYFDGYIEKVVINDIEQKDIMNSKNFVFKEIDDKVQEIYKILDLELINDNQLNNNSIKKRIKDIC